MISQVVEITGAGSPEQWAARLRGAPGVVWLRSAGAGEGPGGRSFLAARPFLTFRAWENRVELRAGSERSIEHGDPWRILRGLIGRYEVQDEIGLPFPLGGCFGYWGYDLKNLLEPRLPRRACNDLGLPDAHLAFYDSLVVVDHDPGRAWIVATGLQRDGSRSGDRIQRAVAFWQELLHASGNARPAHASPLRAAGAFPGRDSGAGQGDVAEIQSTFTRDQFLAAVERAQRYIRAGDIYQVNLAQRLSAPWPRTGWELFRRLMVASPAPFAAWLDCGDFQIASSSPELFLRLSGGSITTRPIKGTRPRSDDAARDAQLSCELQTSAKERAELLMITDLLRNDLGRVCDYGSIHVPELSRLERYSHVQHLVSTVQGRLRPDVTHLDALAACFPGGSVTGAPKIRAMEIIDELEPVTRGPYTGALGYLGFNRQSQVSIVIRTALCLGGVAHFHVGAGIVADSVPEAEYDETWTKAGGFLAALETEPVRGMAAGDGAALRESPA